MALELLIGQTETDTKEILKMAKEMAKELFTTLTVKKSN